MNINYELYKVFYYVAVTLSFSEASRFLHISQSAVSQSVKTLEQKLDQTLFLRSTKRVQLTPEGEILFRHIEPAVMLIQNGEAQLTGDSGMSGLIRIGATDTICRYYLVSYLERLHREYPQIHIQVSTQTSGKCAELLETGQVDVIFTHYPNAHLGPASSVKKIRAFQDVFVANRTFSELKGRKIPLRKLSSYPILMLDRKSTASEFLHQQFLKYQVNLLPEIELSSNDLLIDLARIGLGIAFVPDYAISGYREDLFVVETEETIPPRELAAAYNKKFPLSKAAKTFLDYF